MNQLWTFGDTLGLNAEPNMDPHTSDVVGSFAPEYTRDLEDVTVCFPELRVWPLGSRCHWVPAATGFPLPLGSRFHWAPVSTGLAL